MYFSMVISMGCGGQLVGGIPQRRRAWLVGRVYILYNGIKKMEGAVEISVLDAVNKTQIV